MKRLCVFVGSNLGNHPSYKSETIELGKQIASENIELVYGGSINGLMGVLANTVLENGGKVIGVMPTGLFNTEIVHTKLTEFIEVKDMHERKAKMSDLSDGYIALPGGYGTFEELFEVVSWSQIGIHEKPIGLLNVNFYYNPLLELVEHAIRAGFVKPTHKNVLLASDHAKQLIQDMNEYQKPFLEKK